MVAAIVILICVLATIVNYGSSLFWLSLITVFIIPGSHWLCTYVVAKPEIDEFDETVKQMEANGASDEEISAFIDKGIEYESDYNNLASNLAAGITILTAIAGVVLLIIGILRDF